MFALNFYSPLFIDQLRKGRKTATIRLGNKGHKYKKGQIVWITVGHRHGPKLKIFTAIIDQVDVKPIRELTQREIERDNPEFRLVEVLGLTVVMLVIAIGVFIYALGLPYPMFVWPPRFGH